MEQMMLALTGPTASGKTRLAVALARRLNGEIISADSRQVYRRMDLGTGKDIAEYEEIPYHLIDICEPGTKYNLYRFLSDFRTAYDDIRSRGKLPILCGGTGLYLESAISGITMPDVPENPELRRSLEGKSLEELTEILASMKTLHNVTDVDTPKRAIRAIEIQMYYKEHPEAEKASKRGEAERIPCKILALDISRDLRRERISRRLNQRLADGMLEEVKALLDSGIAPEDLIYYGLEYKYLTLHLIGELSFEEMKNRLEIEIHKFAKRQMTWLRGMERRGFELTWIPWDIDPDALLSQL